MVKSVSHVLGAECGAGGTGEAEDTEKYGRALMGFHVRALQRVLSPTLRAMAGKHVRAFVMEQWHFVMAADSTGRASKARD